MVLKAFSMLDKNRTAAVSVADILSVYDVSQNPDFI
jgi:hypothetical protein